MRNSRKTVRPPAEVESPYKSIEGDRRKTIGLPSKRKTLMIKGNKKKSMTVRSSVGNDIL